MDIATFRRLEPGRQGTDLLEIPHHDRPAFLRALKDAEIIAFLRYLDPDEATEVLRSVSSRRCAALVRQLSEDIKAKVERLLAFHPHEAAGMMDLNYVQVPKSCTFAEVAENLKHHERLTGKFLVILAVEDGRLVGELHGHDLVLRKPSDLIAEDLRPVQTARFDLPEREVLRMVRQHAHARIVVLDADDSIIGVVYTDEVLRAIHAQSTNSLYDFAGVSQEEDVHDPVWRKVKSRWVWLVINLGTAFLAAATVGLFEETIAKTVLLAAYMPIVAGMGGNAATQTLAVMVRGLAMKEVELRTGARVIFSEIGAGLVNGAINGLLVAFVAGVLNENPALGFVTATAMVFNLMVAGCFGALIPMIVQRFGKDPATSATIFITTCTDVLGFFAFLGLASIFL